MGPITEDWKVAEVVARHPETVDVFLRYGCPDMRAGLFSVMARLMSLRNAARVHRIPLAALVADLNRAVAEHAGRPAPPAG